jgi:hypothetical protein
LSLTKFSNVNIAENVEVNWQSVNETKKNNFTISEVAASEKHVSTIQSVFLQNHLKYEIIQIENAGQLKSYFLEIYSNKESIAYRTITDLNNYSGTFNVFELNGENLGSVAVFNGKAKDISKDGSLAFLAQTINSFSVNSGATNKIPLCDNTYTQVVHQYNDRYEVWTVGTTIITIKYVGTTHTTITTVLPYPCDGVVDREALIIQRIGTYSYKNGSGAGSASTILINIEGEKVDPKVETQCFDKSKPAVLTIYVQQPNENTRDKMGANSVGHTFIGIQQGGIERILGFYPDSPNASLISSQNSELHDNSNTLYHISISVEIDGIELANVIKYVNNYPKTYDLNNYNCSDFAIGAAANGGLDLPKTKGSYDAVIVNFKGHNPGDLGEDIRKMNTPSGATKSTTKGNAPKKKGGC